MTPEQQTLLHQYHQCAGWQQDYVQLVAHIGARREVNPAMRKKLRQLARLVAADFKARHATQAATLAALRLHLEQVAYHHHNVAQYATPELEF